jgi:DNA primase large subunit
MAIYDTHELTPEYIEFRDAKFNERYTRERHMHHAYYDDNGKLLRQCARCHKDLADDLHYRSDEPNKSYL